jgi:hypothetical protein
MLFYTWNGGVVGERMRITAAGNVGIGTAVPGALLHVSKAAAGFAPLATSQIVVSNSGGAAYIEAACAAAGDSCGYLFSSGSSLTSYIIDIATQWQFVSAARPVEFIIGGSERMRITTAGNVGIGTTSPTYALHIVKSGAAHQTALSVENQTVGIYGAAIAFRATDSATASVLSAGRIYGVFDAPNFGASRITIQTASSYETFQDVLTVKASNVGVGLTNPATVLHVYKRQDAAITAITVDNDGTTVGIGQAVRFAYGASGSLGGIYHQLDASGLWFLRLKAWTNSAEIERVTINGNTGNVGIGYTSPSVPLSFGQTLGNKIGLWDGGGASQYGFGMQSGILQIYSQGSSTRVGIGYGTSAAFTEILTVTGTGIGIGTTNTASAVTAVGGNGQMRIVAGNYGAIFYNNTADLYFLVTNSGDPYGNWDGHRPFIFNFATGNVTMSHAVSIGNGLTVTGNCNITGQYQVNGVPIGSGGGVTTQNVVTGSRAVNTVYQNTTGKPMFVDVTSPLGQNGTMSAYTDSTSNPTTRVAAVANGSTVQTNLTVSFWVLPGNYYNVNSTGSNGGWTEWY